MSDNSADAIEQDVPRGCECPDCSHPNAPVAFRVKRDGKEFDVCTRCDLPDDEKESLVDADTPAEPFMEYDPLGAMCLSFEVNGDA